MEGCPNRPKSKLRVKPTGDDGLQTYQTYLLCISQNEKLCRDYESTKMCTHSELKNCRCQIFARRNKIAVSRSLQSLAISIKNWQRGKTLSQSGQPLHLACQCHCLSLFSKGKYSKDNFSVCCVFRTQLPRTPFPLSSLLYVLLCWKITPILFIGSYMIAKANFTLGPIK